ncbi:MAG TPA: hypothetical protein VGG69_00925 [Rhizomicrobium sp.]|jgi:predicted nucleic acid-binding protein
MRRERDHQWAVSEGANHPAVWHTVEAVLSETLYLTGPEGAESLAALLRRNRLVVSFELSKHHEAVFSLIRKYEDVPMSLADACLVRMTEILPDPLVLTTDSDFRIYRRHSRQVVPCAMPR